MFILHSGMEWMIAGVVGFAGLMLLLYRFSKGQYGNLILSCALWWIILQIHGNGTAVGAMTATVIMLLFDLVGMPLYRLFRRTT